MKGDYTDPKNQNSPIFPSLHHHKFPLHPQLFQTVKETTAAAAAAAAAAAVPGGGSDGATIEVMKRPRGRPPGSKNKSKPPVMVCHTETSMNPYILEVPGGNDVVEAISRFCCRKGIGLCVLTGSGTVANVTLRQPSNTNPNATITFHGRFDILSISATFLPQTTLFQVPNVLTISIAGPQGQIVGGAVAGPLLAAGIVYVVAASFNNPAYHRLSTEEEMNDESASGGDGQSPPGSGGGDRGQNPAEIGMYNCLPSDVIWAPIARQQPPPPPY